MKIRKISEKCVIVQPCQTVTHQAMQNPRQNRNKTVITSELEIIVKTDIMDKENQWNQNSQKVFKERCIKILNCRLAKNRR